eukprot:544097_1
MSDPKEMKQDPTETTGVDYTALWSGDKDTKVALRPRVIQYPARYVQGNDILRNIGRYLQILPSKAPAVLISKGRKKAFGSLLVKSFEVNSIKAVWLEFGGESSFEEINKQIAAVKALQADDIDSIISIGGGKCIDTGKIVSYKLNKRFVSIPTIASSDAPCSALSIIYNLDHSYKCGVQIRANPECVCVDESIIVNAPPEYFAAGMGDAMATYYEAKTCYENPNGVNMLNTNVTESALCLAKLCCDMLHQYGYDAYQSVKNDKKVTPAVSKVIEANINLSGVGFESGGLALAHACVQGLSGASYFEAQGISHGQMVAIGTVVHLFIEKNWDEMMRVAKFFKSVDLPVCIEDVGFTKDNVKDFDKQLESALDTTMSPAQWFRDNMKKK